MLEDEPPEAVREFALRGDVWTLQFEGEYGQYPKKDSKGLHYIYLLLARPLTPFEASNLDPSRQDARTSQPDSENDGLKKLREEEKRLEDDLEMATDTGNDERAAEMLGELDKIKKAIGQIERTRKRKPSSNAWRAVKLAMERSISRIANKMPKLAAYLTEHVELDSPPARYVPPPGEDARWRF
jgi:hypothetical protein